jgi:hypothetical protein
MPAATMTTGDDLDIPDSFEQAQEAGDATHGAGGDRHGRDLRPTGWS